MDKKTKDVFEDKNTRKLFAMAREGAMRMRGSKSVGDVAQKEAEIRFERSAEYNKGFHDGAKQVLENILMRDCPVRYWNGTEGNAVPVEVIKQKLEKLK